MHQMLQIGLRHWRPVVGLNVLIMILAIVGILNVKKTWTARAQLILPNVTTDLNANLGTLGNVTQGEGLVFTQQIDTRVILSKILLSDTTLSATLDADPEKVSYSNVRAFRELFNVSPAETSTTISLDVEAATPDVAEQRLENLIENFQKQLTVLRQQDAKERSRLIQQELTQAEAVLKDAEWKLINFQEETNLANGETQIAELVKTINTLSTAQAELKSRLLASQATVSSLSSQLGQSPDQALQSLRIQANSVYQANRARLAEVEVELSKARVQRTENHPRVVALREERAAILSQVMPSGASLSEVGSLGLDNVLNANPISNLSQQLVGAQAEVATLQSQSDELQRQIDQFNTELSRISRAQATFRELQRQYNIAEGVYNGLVAQLNATKSSSFSSYPNVQVLDAPKVDPKPSGPGKRVVAMGAVLSSLLGSAAIVFYREGQNPLLLSDDLKEIDIPILGRIPNIQHVSFSQERSPWRSAHHLLHWFSPFASATNGNGAIVQRYNFPEANAEFQRSASTLRRYSIPKGRLLISSPIPGEGKTTITFGLASALSNLGFRVLLVDANLHNRSLSHQLGYDAQKREDPVSFPARIASHLDFLPLEIETSVLGQFFAQHGFREVLDSLQDKHGYDYVLVDAASVSTSSELSLMVAVIPNLLLVIWPGKSLRKPFVDSFEKLRQYGATIQGLLLNGVDDSVPDSVESFQDSHVEGVRATL